jgi:hypothetical protein
MMNFLKSIQVANYILQKPDFIRAKVDKLSQVKRDSYFYKDGYNLRFRYREHCYYEELSETEKEMLNEIDKKYHSLAL